MLYMYVILILNSGKLLLEMLLKKNTRDQWKQDQGSEQESKESER